MTVQKPRDPGTHEDALALIVGHFGNADNVGRIIGVGRGRIYAAMDADQLNHSTLNFDQMVTLGAAYAQETGKPSPFVWAMRASVAERIGGAPGPDMTPVERVGAVSSETNDVVQSIIASVCPKSERGEEEAPRECLQIVRQIDQAIAELERHRRYYTVKAGVSADIRPAGVVALTKSQDRRAS
jgi:hypothetical protein